MVTYRANRIKLDEINANMEIDDDGEGKRTMTINFEEYYNSLSQQSFGNQRKIPVNAPVGVFLWIE